MKPILILLRLKAACKLIYRPLERCLGRNCQRQFKFDPFGYEFGNLNLTPHLLNITHAW